VAIILSGNAAAALLSFARNLLIARLLSIEDFGIAATFALSMSLVEMASAMGLQQLIVQARDGEDADLQAALQAFNLLRGVASGLALFLLAKPIAVFFAVPDLAWAYQLLGLVPFARGLEHFDIHRLTRQRRYGPILISRGLPILLALAAVWPLALVFGDYQVMLYSILLQHGLAVVASHAMAERRFGLRADRAVFRRSLVFGWPLLLNNALLFGVMQGDRVIVAREYGLEILAIFSMGLTLTMTPIAVLAQSISLFFLPRLSAAQDDPRRFHQLALASIEVSLLAGLLLVMATALVGGPVVLFLLGERYAELVPLLVWFAIWQALRGLKTGGALVALSRSRTTLQPIANVVRACALPAAWLAAQHGVEPQVIIWIATVGELAAFLVSSLLLQRWFGLSLRMIGLMLLLPALLSVLVCVRAKLIEDGIGAQSWITTAIIFLFVLSLAPMKRSIAIILHLRQPHGKRQYK